MKIKIKNYKNTKFNIGDVVTYKIFDIIVIIKEIISKDNIAAIANFTYNEQTLFTAILQLKYPTSSFWFPKSVESNIKKFTENNNAIGYLVQNCDSHINEYYPFLMVHENFLLKYEN